MALIEPKTVEAVLSAPTDGILLQATRTAPHIQYRLGSRAPVSRVVIREDRIELPASWFAAEPEAFDRAAALSERTALL